MNKKMILSQKKDIWFYFNQLNAIPRPSGSEEKVRNYIVDFARQSRLAYEIDDIGNVLVKKPASSGMENKETVTLQSHMDMVCEKDTQIIHDFYKDPIQTYVAGDWMYARGTTLGADNGIGIAAQLALLSDSTLHAGEIACLFTVDEESGLTGARHISEKLLQGKFMINLDSEEDNEIFIGSAGGIDTIAQFECEYETAGEHLFFFLVTVDGLEGGHSGDDINKGRANANKILASYLSILKERCQLRLFSIEGGNLRNAIPREASALCAVPFSKKEEVRVLLNLYIADVETDYGAIEKGFSMDISSEEKRDRLIKQSISDSIIEGLNNCTNGVIEMSSEFDDLVQTSTNLASIKMINDKIIVSTSQRSFDDEEKNKIATEIETLFCSLGAKVMHENNYPGWKPNFQSELLAIARESYVELFKQEPIIRSIHAGLESGMFLEKYPDLDIISIGPTIRDVHSPKERLSVSSVDKFRLFLLEILKNIPDKHNL